MSVSPRQNFWKPPPVPEMPTVTRTPGVTFWNSSATASLMGKTVLEPSRVTVAAPPDRPPSLLWPPPPQPATATVLSTTKSRESCMRSGYRGPVSPQFPSCKFDVNVALQPAEPGRPGPG